MRLSVQIQSCDIQVHYRLLMDRWICYLEAVVLN